MQKIQNITKSIVNSTGALVNLKIIECGDFGNSIIYYCIVNNETDLQLFINEDGEWEVLNNYDVPFLSDIVGIIEDNF